MAISKKSLLAIQAPMLVVGSLASLIILLDVLLPFTSAHADVVPAYLLYFAFFTAVFFIYSTLTIMFEMAAPVGDGPIRSPHRCVTRCMTVACVISILGILALIVDRAVYQGVDFLTQSFVEVRSQLNARREPGSSASSVFSVFGNLFQFSYFFTFICLVYYYEGIGCWRRVGYGGAILLCLLAGSYILGGRTIAGLGALTLLAMLVARIVSGRSSVRQLFRLRVLIGLGLTLLLVIGIVVYVFHSRAGVSGLDSATYLHNFVAHLRGRQVVESQSCSEAAWCDVVNYLQLSGIYVTHVFWVLAEIISNPYAQSQGNPIFGGFSVILAKVVGSLSNEYEFAGLFNSLPGSLFYQYGWLGVAVGALLISFGFALAVIGLRRRSSIDSVVLFYALFMVLLVAPVLSIFNMMVYAFMLFSIIFMVGVCMVGVSMGKRLLV